MLSVIYTDATGRTKQEHGREMWSKAMDRGEYICVNQHKRFLGMSELQ